MYEAKHCAELKEERDNPLDERISVLRERSRLRSIAKHTRTCSRFYVSVEDIKESVNGIEPCKFTNTIMDQLELVSEQDSLVNQSSTPAQITKPRASRRAETSPIINYSNDRPTSDAVHNPADEILNIERIHDYNPIAVKNRILYENSQLPVPTQSTWKSIKSSGVDTVRGFWHIFRRKVVCLLMMNDGLLTYSDASSLYKALRKYLDVRDYEFLFNYKLV